MTGVYWASKYMRADKWKEDERYVASKSMVGGRDKGMIIDNFVHMSNIETQQRHVCSDRPPSLFKRIEMDICHRAITLLCLLSKSLYCSIQELVRSLLSSGHPGLSCVIRFTTYTILYRIDPFPHHDHPGNSGRVVVFWRRD
jgi:hypothetical protein